MGYKMGLPELQKQVERAFQCARVIAEHVEQSMAPLREACRQMGLKDDAASAMMQELRESAKIYFKYTEGDPEAWFERGEQHEKAAQLLGQDISLNHIRIMLLGYALECYLKGISKATNKKSFPIHNLLELMDDAGITVDPKDGTALIWLWHFSLWAGRYPHHKRLTEKEEAERDKRTKKGK